MKILVVDELCPPQLGGIQVRFNGLAKQWVAMGHEVHITAIDHLGTSVEMEIIDGINYHRILKDDGYYKGGAFGRKLSTIFAYTFKLRPFFKREWDLIIFCQFPILPQLFYKFFCAKKSITALDFVEYRDSKLWKIINKIIINNADHIICISEHVRRCVSEYRKDNLDIIPSFVDTTTCLAKTKRNLIFLGRMEAHKHPELAIDGVIEYNQAYDKNLHLNVVGGGSMLDSLKSKYREVAFVTFFGSVDEVMKAEILANGRVLILPSEREGLPIVVIEALAFEVPTLTADYAGNGTKYFVEDQQIGVVALPNATDIAAKLNELETNYDDFVNQCKKIKGDYDIKKISKKYLEIFQ